QGSRTLRAPLPLLDGGLQAGGVDRRLGDAVGVDDPRPAAAGAPQPRELPPPSPPPQARRSRWSSPSYQASEPTEIRRRLSSWPARRSTASSRARSTAGTNSAKSGR